MKPLHLELVQNPERDFAAELARLRNDHPDPVVLERRRALADVIERAWQASRRPGAKP